MQAAEAMAALKTLVAIAWADGRLDPRELNLLDALAESSELPEGLREELRDYAREPKTLADAPLELLGPEARRDVLARAVVLSLIDGFEHPAERAMIAELATRLALPDTEQVLAEGAARARRLLELL